MWAETAVRNVINICLRSTRRGWRPCENKTMTLTRITTVECGSHGCVTPSPLCFSSSLLPTHCPCLNLTLSSSLLASFYFLSAHLSTVLCFLSCLPFPISSPLGLLIPLCLCSCFLHLVSCCPHLLCIFSSLLLLPLLLHSKHNCSLCQRLDMGYSNRRRTK